MTEIERELPKEISLGENTPTALVLGLLTVREAGSYSESSMKRAIFSRDISSFDNGCQLTLDVLFLIDE